VTQWAVAPSEPTPDLVAAVEDAIGQRATSWRKPHTGITPAQRFVVTFEDGSSVFVKAPVDAQTVGWSRTEHYVLSHIEADFIPRVIHSTESLLITEDLSHAHWPADHEGAGSSVLWKPGQIDALLATLDRVAVAAPELELPSATEGRELFWPRIAKEPDAFLAPDVPRQWIDALLEAEATFDFGGGALVHNDVRSDNVCFVGTRAVLVDWSNARRGNPIVDRAELALTYAIEGGPPPYELVPDAGTFPAWEAGLLLTRAVEFAGRAPDWLVSVFQRMGAIALDWAARNLSL
jgi:phosphotransferase family enzyme